eukprot:g2591.t1
MNRNSEVQDAASAAARAWAEGASNKAKKLMDSVVRIQPNTDGAIDLLQNVSQSLSATISEISQCEKLGAFRPPQRLEMDVRVRIKQRITALLFISRGVNKLGQLLGLESSNRNIEKTVFHVIESLGLEGQTTEEEEEEEEEGDYEKEYDDDDDDEQDNDKVMNHEQGSTRHRRSSSEVLGDIFLLAESFEKLKSMVKEAEENCVEEEVNEIIKMHNFDGMIGKVQEKLSDLEVELEAVQESEKYEFSENDKSVEHFENESNNYSLSHQFYKARKESVRIRRRRSVVRRRLTRYGRSDVERLPLLKELEKLDQQEVNVLETLESLRSQMDENEKKDQLNDAFSLALRFAEENLEDNNTHLRPFLEEFFENFQSPLKDNSAARYLLIEAILVHTKKKVMKEYTMVKDEINELSQFGTTEDEGSDDEEESEEIDLEIVGRAIPVYYNDNDTAEDGDGISIRSTDSDENFLELLG